MRIPYAIAVLAAVLHAAPALAADHAEAPLASADPAADIADFYIWYDDGKFISVVTFASFGATGDTGYYDDQVIYTVHVDTNGDNVSDIQTRIQFGQNGDGDWGVRVLDLPGANSAAVSGAVETTIDAGNGLSVYAGARDDPFFFNQNGFNNTLATGTLAFDGTDDVAGLNVTAIVVEMDSAAIVGDDHNIQFWATTARKNQTRRR